MAVALLAVNAVSAQVSVHAGYVQNNLISSYTIPVINSTKYDTLSRPGAYVGFNYNIKLAGDLGLTLGANVEYFAKKDSALTVTRKFQQLDLVVPAYLNYAIPFGNGNSFTIFAGPTFGLGLMNKSTYTEKITGLVTDYNYFDSEDATNEAYYRERFTWALTGGVRINLGGIGFHAGYTYGMSDNFTSANTKGTSKRIFVGANLNL